MFNHYKSNMVQKITQKKEIRNMNHNEISIVIDELKKAIAEDELYNECMSYGLPNQ